MAKVVTPETVDVKNPTPLVQTAALVVTTAAVVVTAKEVAELTPHGPEAATEILPLVAFGVTEIVSVLDVPLHPGGKVQI
jgi:hypothetical protein